MLVLHEDPSTFRDYSAEDIQQVIERYRAWGERLREAGHMAGGEKLRDGSGRVLRRQNGQLRIVDGPFSESKEVLGGFYMILAATYEQAVERARDCPHLDYGGTIEIREVEDLQ
jgi:hypothetical protein